MQSVGAGCQRHVRAVIDEEGRPGPRADLPKGPGVAEQLLRGRARVPQLHSSRATGEDGERRLDGRSRVARRRRDQVQPDHAAPITPASGLDALPYSFLGMRPARYASRPASVASFIARAMAPGSLPPERA